MERSVPATICPPVRLSDIGRIDPHCFRDLTAFINHERALELDHYFTVLIEPDRLHPHDTDTRPRLRLAFFQHFASRVNRVAFEDRTRQAHFIPAEVCHHI